MLSPLSDVIAGPLLCYIQFFISIYSLHLTSTMHKTLIATLNLRGLRESHIWWLRKLPVLQNEEYSKQVTELQLSKHRSFVTSWPVTYLAQLADGPTLHVMWHVLVLFHKPN